MRKANLAISRQEPENRESMKHLKSLRFPLMLLFSLFMATMGTAQITVDTSTCRCTDGIFTEDIITIMDSDGNGEPWILIDYDGISTPDSVLWHNADTDVDDNYYLNFDETTMHRDTLKTTSASAPFVYTFTSYRNPDIAFNNVVFIRTSGGMTDTVRVNLPQCTAPMDGLIGVGLATTLRDTVCLDISQSMGSRYQFQSGFDVSMIDTITWYLTGTGITPGTGSGAPFNFDNTFLLLNWAAAGDYTVRAEGMTVTNCPFDSEIDVHVVDTDITVEGFAFGCVMGDTMPFNLSSNFTTGVYDSIVWEIIPPAQGHFVGDSVDVSSVNIVWNNMPGTYQVVAQGFKNSGVVCDFVDTMDVTIGMELMPNITANVPQDADGEYTYCLGDMGRFTASVNNLDSIKWALHDSSMNVIVGDSLLDSVFVMMNQVGRDTLYLSGTTMMGCIVRDTIAIDVKDSQIMLSGDTRVCVGQEIGYRAMYTDGTIANFVDSVEWTVTPMVPAMDVQRDSVAAKDDSLTVMWGAIGNYEIRVRGLTDLGCMLEDVISVSVQDTSFIIIGETLACAGQPFEYRLVQASDSSDVITGDSISWQLVRSIMVDTLPLERPERIDTMLDNTPGNDTLMHSFSTGTFSDDDSYYLVIATGVSSNGCAFSDTLRVETIGQPDLVIGGPDMICSGAIDTFTFSLADSLLVPGTPNWSAFYMDGSPVSPFYLDQVAMDTLVVTFPNQADSFRINFTAQIVGSGCMINAEKIVASEDMIDFISPTRDSICLTDSTWFLINVDTADVDLAGITFELEDLATNAVSNLTATNSGSQLATYVKWPGAGQYEIRAVGYTNDQCRIQESFTATVKDTNYIISGDMQVCIGDTLEYVFLQGWDNAAPNNLIERRGFVPIATSRAIGPNTFNIIYPNSDTVAWGLSLSGSGSVLPGFAEFTGLYRDTVRIVFDSVGTYTLSGSALTDCFCEVDAEINITVRGSEFLILGPQDVCDASTTGTYYIANTDSSRIDDLIPDSTTWTLASGLTNGRILGASNADSVIVSWNRNGSFASAVDTIFFESRADDGCMILDTLPITLHSSDYSIIGDLAVCEGDAIDFRLANAFDSTTIAGLDTLMWVIGGDTIVTPSLDTLDRLDMAGTMTSWTTPGTYTIQAFGTTAHGCVVFEQVTVTVFGGANATIMGDENTCYRTDGSRFEPDVYRLLNVSASDIQSIEWEIIPYGPYPQPIHNGLTANELVITEWTSAGNSGNAEDYRIKVTGTSLGGCTFADSMDVVILPTAEAFTMVCNNSVNVTVPFSCNLELTPDMFLEDWEIINATVPMAQFEVRIKDPSTGRVLSNFGLVDPSMIGKQLDVEVEHECSGQICWGKVLIEDKNIPTLVCGADTVECNGNYLPNQLDFDGTRVQGFPVPDTAGITVTSTTGQNRFIVRNFERCGEAILEYNDRIEEEICVGDFGTIIYRDWTMTNQAGLTSTCTDTILFKRLHIDTFLTMFEEQLRDSTFECGENVIPFANPQFDLDRFCFNIQYTSDEVTDLLCSDNPNTYSTTKTWTILDWCTGVVRKVSQTIRVDDNTPPRITLRGSDIRTQATEHFCFGVIELTPNDISIQDPSLCSDIDSVHVRVFEETIPGQLIAERGYSGNFTNLIISDPNILVDLSTIFIVVEARDQCGNMSSDTVSRNVIISDDIAPDPVCDEEVVVNLNDEGWGFASYKAFDRGSADNCGPVEICITRVDDEEIFTSLDRDRNNLVLYSDFVTAINNAGREGTNYTKLTTISNVQYIHRDSLCVSKLKFECTDAMASFLDQDVSVRMKVTDINGRSATCLSTVEVRDNGVIDSIVVVKGDTTLVCGSDYSSFIPFDGGNTVRFLTNCGIPLVPSYQVDTSGLNSCGLGLIRRIFRATDRDNRSFTHIQNIRIGDTLDIVDPDRIANFWPQDFTGVGCPGSNIDPENMDPQYVPKFRAEDYPCSNADMIHSDLPFYNVEGYCVKILRTWTLVDWCQQRRNDPNAGQWEYVQVLKLSDTIAPVITMDATATVATNNTNACSAFVTLEGQATDCFDAADLDWSYRIEQGGALIAQGNTRKINRDLAEGVYSVEWKAADKCGNEDTFTQSLVIVDGVAPAVSCQDITVNLAAGGRVTLDAVDLISNATDACDGSVEIHFDNASGPMSRVFDCDDLNGQASRVVIQTIVGVDDRGNVGECRVRITLTDTNNTCGRATGNSGMIAIQGEIATASSLTVDNVEVVLRNSEDVEMSKVFTPVDGQYNFADVPMTGQYDISARRIDSYDNGVSTLDMIHIQRHILGLKALDSPYKVIAADVDGSDKVSSSDLVAIRRLLLGKDSELPIRRAWTFVDASETFANPVSPFPYSQELSLADVTTDMSGQNFIAIKMGDVDGNAFLESSKLAGTRSAAAIAATMTQVDGDLYRIDLSTETADITGLQAALQIDADLADIVSVGSEAFAISDDNYTMTDDGLIKLSLIAQGMTASSETMVSIMIRAKDGAELTVEDVVSLSDASIANQLYADEASDVITYDIALEYADDAGIVAEGLELLQNVPNPFAHSTKVGFYNPADSEVSIRVYSLSGQVVYRHRAQYDKGWHQLTLQASDLDGPGMYIYEINNGTEIVHKRMMSL